DGAAAGTVLVESGYVTNLTNVNGTLFFSAGELWKSDGTEAGTVLIKDIFPGGSWDYTYYGNFYTPNSSNPSNLTNVNGTLFFTASDGVHGRELWKSDGTEAGTVLVKDVKPGYTSSYPSDLTAVNGTLFFSASDAVHGLELWKCPAPPAGAVLVKDIFSGSTSSYPSYLTNVNGTLFFSPIDTTHGWELWKSDGTAAGTVLVKDVNPGSDSS